MEEAEFRLTVNGAERSVTCEPDTPLLDVFAQPETASALLGIG